MINWSVSSHGLEDLLSRKEDAYEATDQWDIDDKGDYPDKVKRNLEPKRHRCGAERSKKKRKKYGREKPRDELTAVEEEEALINAQVAALNGCKDVKDAIAQILRDVYMDKYGREPMSSQGHADPARV